MNLYLGDCLVEMSKIQSGTVDLVCADMPYGTTNCKWDSCIPLEQVWAQIDRIIKPNAAVVLFAQTPFDKVLGVSRLDWLRYEWIWEKTNATGFFNAKKMPLKAHENILVFYKSLPQYFPIKTTGHPRKTAGRKPVDSEVYGKAVHKTFYDSTERYPRSVLKVKSDKLVNSLHPTQKPIELLEYLISTYSKPNDVVLDFCMGSGTAGVACQNLERKFIGIEKESKYFDIALNRLNENKKVAA